MFFPRFFIPPPVSILIRCPGRIRQCFGQPTLLQTISVENNPIFPGNSRRSSTEIDFADACQTLKHSNPGLGFLGEPPLRILLQVILDRRQILTVPDRLPVALFDLFFQPRNLGGWVQGGNTAATIMKRFIDATKDRWEAEDFVAPPGVRMVKIDRRSGKRVFEGTPSDEPTATIIWEAFKPDTEPPRATRSDEIAAKRNEILELIRRGRAGAQAAQDSDRGVQPNDFVEDQGGIY